MTQVILALRDHKVFKGFKVLKVTLAIPDPKATPEIQDRWDRLDRRAIQVMLDLRDLRVQPDLRDRKDQPE